jgi:magnesium transporter
MAAASRAAISPDGQRHQLAAVLAASIQSCRKGVWVLLAHRPEAAARQTLAAGDTVPEGAVWLDLIDPTVEEQRMAEAATGLRVPAQAEIAEIENSSRLRQEGAGLYLSMPITAPRADGGRALLPLGFVLSPHHLITVRYSELPAFDRYADTLPGLKGSSSAELFAGLVEALVDRLADLLEQAGADLDAVSKRVFHTDSTTTGGARQEDAMLQATLRRIGLADDLTSKLRASLLGIGRIAAYVADTARWLAPEVKPRFTAIRQDVASLTEFDAQLTGKIQFLLDATLGFLNIQQNNVLKILTVVSIVGIPPTLIASIYGMNFKTMPELNWSFGYPYGLAMIGLSIVVPLLCFKWKGWL